MPSKVRLGWLANASAVDRPPEDGNEYDHGKTRNQQAAIAAVWRWGEALEGQHPAEWLDPRNGLAILGR
jgi:hypothetical protein